jgi:hypothetical protein
MSDAETALATSPRTSCTKTRSPASLPTPSVLAGKKSDEKMTRYRNMALPDN